MALSWRATKVPQRNIVVTIIATEYTRPSELGSYVVEPLFELVPCLLTGL
jgi:hypothetical protein